MGLEAFPQEAQDVARLQRENAELRARIQDPDASPELAELASDSHLQARDDLHDSDLLSFDDATPRDCQGTFPLMMDDFQGASKDAIFQRLQRERVVLLCDLNSFKAKFELMLQTLRATLRLGADATWADVLEHCEALGEGRYADGQGLPGKSIAEAEEAEMERETLEERLEAQSAHITRLRELLQKQQRLLDMTAGQIHDQHQQSKKQAEQLVESGQREADQREALVQKEDASASQDSKNVALLAHNERLMEEIRTQREHAARLEDQLQREVKQHHEATIREESLAKREGERANQLLDQLAGRESEAKRYRSDCERQKQVIKELTDGLATQNQAYDELRDRVEVQDAEHRRHYSYQDRGNTTARTPDHRVRGSGDDGSSPGDDMRDDEHNGSSNGYPAPQRGGGGSRSALQSARGPPSARQVPMDDEERDAFLSHFPMAQRTERLMRTRMEGERRKKVGLR